VAGVAAAADDDGSPRVISGRNGETEVIFPNDCIVYFDRRDQQIAQLRPCRSGQLRQAERSIEWYRRRERQESREDGVPRIVAGRRGEADVVFANRCTVSYGREGEQVRSTSECRPRQLKRAETAIAQHRIDQNLSSGRAEVIRDGGDDAPSVIEGRNGAVDVSFPGNNCVVSFDAQGAEIRRLPVCGPGQVQRAGRVLSRHREQLRGGDRR